MKPLIATVPPGPKAQAILRRDAGVISQSMVREYPLVVDRAEGMNLWDVDGNRYLDFSAGIAVMNLGWNHPDVVQAVTDQVRKLSHGAFLDYCSETPVRFAEKLVSMLPGDLNRVYLSNSGAETIEAALKLARHHTKRKYFIAFYGGFHGRTYGALSLTASRVIQRKYFGPFLPVIHVPYPNPYRPFGFKTETCDVDVIQYLEEEVFPMEVSPEEVAAIIVEPIQGEGGYVVPPRTFLKRLREVCDKYGILLIVDEVQSGCFRTGTFLASEQFGIVPDIVCLSKALGGGFPLGVTVASEDVMNWPPGSHASTFGGNNAACAAALATLTVMDRPGFGEHVTDMGEYLIGKLRALQKRHEVIGDVRGMGLMVGAELVRNRTTKEPAKEERTRVLNESFRRGLTMLPAGVSVIRFCPPLVIEKRHIDTGMEILDHSLELLQPAIVV
ncbi:acetyl ornithine aminotransferase family protein [Methanogenium sp. S4BF]|uniref:acetyl ornithine aminotransferase family protein n=1 Tax=Methanogenium sp. S4BF TaxID=1789226 RepID=UPI00241702B2|nr:acetyl ornithine aminotransferase family protein [Methanogenium sp. S4BF]WFN34496.1 acetyl ornithine aminotransferase family protein [Methanogenium sp. S4BF]